MLPVVSIVMPCFNACDHLERSVGSVRNQTYTAWELLIVDDGSTDESWQRLCALAARDSRIRPLRQHNAGAAAARNRGLTEVTGEFVAFLDADDTWAPTFLEAMTSALSSNTTAMIAYCGWRNIGLGGLRDRPFVPPDYETPDKIVSLLRGCRWPIHAALMRGEAMKLSGGFDVRLSACEDFDLWLRLGSMVPLLRVPEVLAFYHHHGQGQITENRARIAITHWHAQKKFLREHPEIAKQLGRREARRLTAGELLQRGYASYWQGDLVSARRIFRIVMYQGHGSASDWAYMLPSLLPLALHRTLRRAFGTRNTPLSQ